MSTGVAITKPIKLLCKQNEWRKAFFYNLMLKYECLAKKLPRMVIKHTVTLTLNHHRTQLHWHFALLKDVSPSKVSYNELRDQNLEKISVKGFVPMELM